MLHLDERQHIARAFAPGDRGLCHALLAGIEHPIGQQDTLPADLEEPVGIATGPIVNRRGRDVIPGAQLERGGRRMRCMGIGRQEQRRRPGKAREPGRADGTLAAIRAISASKAVRRYGRSISVLTFIRPASSPVGTTSLGTTSF